MGGRCLCTHHVCVWAAGWTGKACAETGCRVACSGQAWPRFRCSALLRLPSSQATLRCSTLAPCRLAASRPDDREGHAAGPRRVFQRGWLREWPCNQPADSNLGSPVAALRRCRVAADAVQSFQQTTMQLVVARALLLTMPCGCLAAPRTRRAAVTASSRCGSPSGPLSSSHSTGVRRGVVWWPWWFGAAYMVWTSKHDCPSKSSLCRVPGMRAGSWLPIAVPGLPLPLDLPCSPAAAAVFPLPSPRTCTPPAATACLPPCRGQCWRRHRHPVLMLRPARGGPHLQRPLRRVQAQQGDSGWWGWASCAWGWDRGPGWVGNDRGRTRLAASFGCPGACTGWHGGSDCKNEA